ncbi:hypothetical protein OH77DRAFT_1577289 [Trametes cingulata]|nr:hypothetical protein OH77DRAFT_1577289 [Trametes cingulata]
MPHSAPVAEHSSRAARRLNVGLSLIRNTPSTLGARCGDGNGGTQLLSAAGSSQLRIGSNDLERASSLRRPNSRDQASRASSACVDAHSSPSVNGDVSDTAHSTHSVQRARTDPGLDQPLTIHGKPRERVFLACVQCRTRKMRCDGAKPECHNCAGRRKKTLGPCAYDDAPRRRGKDRTPGSRALAPLLPKKTRTTRSRVEEEAKRRRAGHSLPACPSRDDRTSHPAPDLPTSSSSAVKVDPSSYSITRNPRSDSVVPNDLVLRPTDLVATALHEPAVAVSTGSLQNLAISSDPSIHFVRETWWDGLLSFYASSPDRASTTTVILRSEVVERINADLRLLFRVSLLWYSFIDVPRFFATFCSTLGRQTIQPSLILSMLALSTLLQSSKLELGAKGMDKALRLADQAYAAFHASLNTGWIDIGLVQAAYVLAAFELQAHPQGSPERTHGAIATLDSLIRYLSLTTLDVDDPRTTIFLPQAVPSVPRDTPPVATPRPEVDPLATAVLPFSDEGNPMADGGESVHGLTSAGGCSSCGCQPYSLGHQWPSARQLAPQFAQMPMWPAHASDGETRREECRRVVWASVILVTALYTTRATACERWGKQYWWIQDPANYALLFPGESLACEGTLTVASSKDSVWALYIRALFLWCSCLRMQGYKGMDGINATQYAVCASSEADAIEAALDRHSCMVETGFCVKMREVFFCIRMCLSKEAQRDVPPVLTNTPHWLMFRDKAEQWMTQQMCIADYFTQCLRNPRPSIANHARRNFLVAWLMAQISRALTLWHTDRALGIALDVARAFAPSAEYYMRIWSCPSQEHEFEKLHAQLVEACLAAGMDPPLRTVPLGSVFLADS